MKAPERRRLKEVAKATVQLEGQTISSTVAVVR